MKKKLLITVSIASALALVAFVKPVQTLATEVLSVFRVNDVQTIQITLADLQEGMQNVANLQKELKAKYPAGFKGEGIEHKSLINVISQPQHQVRELEKAEDFKAFRMRLPKELEGQTPAISALEASEFKFTLDVQGINGVLTTLKSPKQLTPALDKVEMTLKSSGAALVKYEDVLFTASQKSHLDAPEAAKTELREVMLNLPVLPTHLRQQLAETESDSNHIYLPVFEGFGREVDLGNQKGYIYTLADLKGIIESFSQDMPMTQTGTEASSKYLDHAQGKVDEAKVAEFKAQFIAKHGEDQYTALLEAHKKAMEDISAIDYEKASMLIWTKDGNLYTLTGNKTDAELAKIARSVR
ncbi:MAG: DUF4367 domain-containing protein [Desulfitobacterium sp.]